MGIVLIDSNSEQDRLELGDGAAILFTRAPGEEVARALHDAALPDGVPDPVKAASVLMARHVVGWEGFVTSKGEDVPFSREAAPQFVARLPYLVRLRLDAAIISIARFPFVPLASGEEADRA